MAAEMVICENIERTLSGRDVVFPVPLRDELDRLQDVVRWSQGAIVFLYGQGRDQIREDSLIRGRFENLSTKLHQADDLLDQIITFDYCPRIRRGERAEHGRVNLRHLMQQGANVLARITQEVSFFLPLFNRLLLKEMAGRIREIRNDLQSLIAGLINEVNNLNNLPDQRQFRPTGEFRQAGHEVIGREKDKAKIVNMLLQLPRDSKTNVSVICMSGLPGVGKSALAKDIYDDHKVKSHFDLRMWIPVSHLTDDTEIIREIVESCTNRRSSYSHNTQSAHYHDSQVHQNDTPPFRGLLGCRSSTTSISLPNNSAHETKILYERRLRKEITGKVYLLVLDDFRLRKWQSLRDLLDAGARGSQILLTTQISELANLVNSETPKIIAYPLPGLSKQDSWTLFKTLALKTEEHCDGEMEKTGFKIVEICKHLPFTIKVAARLLHGRNRSEWLPFKEDIRLIRDQKEDVMEHVLRLSFSDLPTRLRACFGYCSLFPDGFIFNKRDLISLWIAQGFVNPHDGHSPEDVREPQDAPSLEEIGDMYFMELSRRCFFEQVSSDPLEKILKCKIHHIIGTRASKLMAGVANIYMTDFRIQAPDQTFKHLSVNCPGDLSSKFSSPLLKCPSLRTLIFVKERDSGVKLDTLLCNQLISNYRRLRVLDLHDLGLKELPDSIGEQIHLRYLNISKNDGLVSLPKSFTRLHNLQTLKLNSCPKLERLTSDFGLLVNLKRFELDDCDRLKCMPLGLEKLTQLEILSRFVVEGSSKQITSVGLRELSGLKMLKGRLSIELPGDSLITQAELEKDLIKNISKLNEVKIRWAQRTSGVEGLSKDEISAQEKILEHLQPNPNLKILCIEGYKGRNFPTWTRRENIISSLPNLVIISIEGCGECEFLPPFGELACLRILTLRHMTNVQYIEEQSGARDERSRAREADVQGCTLYKSLEELTLHNFYNLEGWCKEVTSIKKVETQSFPSLSKLRIRNCPNLKSLPSFPVVLDLKLHNVNQMLLDDCERKASSLKKNIGFSSLLINGCPNLDFKVVSKGLGGLPSLTNLVIERCDALCSLADEVGKLSSLERLMISNCKELDLSHESQIWHRVAPHLPQPLITMSPWKNLKRLRELTLREIPKMKALPDGIRHLRALKTLRISSCKSLGSLPVWIGSLTSLQHLRIESCRGLKRLPQELEKVTTLMKVEITECPELIERCREHTGEDWIYIKHARVLLHKSWRYGYIS